MWQKTLERSLPWISARLRLRLVTPDDAALLTRLANDPEVRRYIGPVLNVTEAGTRESLLQMAGAAASLYVATEVTSGESIGCCGFTGNSHLGSDVQDTLIELLPQHHRKGYGYEILCLLRDAWLLIARRPCCIATVWPNNERAIGILKSAGFVEDGEYTDLYGERRLVFRCGRSDAT
jgi:RimJ/RimL family protein N-acetyltransferase